MVRPMTTHWFLQETYGMMFNDMHENMRPKLLYRSNSTKQLYAVYPIELYTDIIVVMGYKAAPSTVIRVLAAWILPSSKGKTPMAHYTQALADIEHHINYNDWPAGRNEYPLPKEDN